MSRNIMVTVPVLHGKYWGSRLNYLLPNKRRIPLKLFVAEYNQYYLRISGSFIQLLFVLE
jgi:hypothetical protein